MYIIHITCTVQEIKTYKIESIFLDHAVYLEIDATIDVIWLKLGIIAFKAFLKGTVSRMPVQISLLYLTPEKGLGWQCLILRRIFISRQYVPIQSRIEFIVKKIKHALRLFQNGKHLKRI